jgi:hypothetical protein
MKKGKRRRHASAGHPNHQHAPVTDRRIIPINDGPVRQRAAKEYNRTMEKLEKARAELQRFEQEDRPALGRWMAATFGAFLTEIRENARLIHEQEGLILDVETEMICSNHQNPRRAYAAVMKRRESPQEEAGFAEGEAWRDGTKEGATGGGDDAGDDEDFDPFEGMGAEIPKEDREALFDDFVRSVLGFNPKQMPKGEYAQMFAEFEAEMFGKRPEASAARTRDREKPSAGREVDRIKEIYRILVRRLHPDTRRDGDATVSATWHEVQEAYEARNLERLETLLALTEMEGGKNGGQASLSQMRAALAELNRALRAIHRSLGEAKRDPAWGFSRTPYHAPMEKRIRREMEEDLAEQRWVLADLKRTLDDWSRPWHPPVKKTKKQSKPPERPKGVRAGYGSSVPRAVQTEFFAF